MKHLLIPTDFSIHSLKAVQAAVDAIPGHPLKITLFHLLSMPVAVTELLRRPKSIKGLNLVSEEFNDACAVLKNKYSSRIKDLKIEIAVGETKAFLANYLEGAKVDVVILQAGAKLDLPCKRSIDMVRLIRRTGWYTMEVAVATPVKVRKTAMSNLLITEEQ